MRHSLYEAEHEEFRAMVRAWAEKTVVPFHAQWEKDGIVPREVWLSGGAQGLLGMDVEEEFGGGGVRDFRYNAVLDEEMTRIGASGVGFGLHNDVVGPYLRDLATEEQKQRWLPGFASGELITAIAMTEPGAGSDLQGIQTTRPQGRRRLGAERLEDVHHQRHQRRPGHRRRQDRSRGAGLEGHQPARRRAGHARLQPRPQPGEGRASRRRTPRSCSSTRCGCRPRTCSAPRTAASTT